MALLGLSRRCVATSLKGCCRSLTATRALASDASQFFTVAPDEKLKGVSVLTMHSKPVNGMNLDFLNSLNSELDKLEADNATKGLIITSGVPNIFSAGLDIMEMYNPDPERLRLFWRTLQDYFIKLYGSGMITAAAINGTSPAGGCLTALCCDLRIFANEPKFKIGLNEALLGIMVPPWFVDAYVQTIGVKEAQRACQMGYMFTPSEALEVKLVDKLVPFSDVMDATRQEMAPWLKIPIHARQLIKQEFRSPLLNKMMSQREEDIKNTVDFLTRDSIQKSLGAYLQALKKGAKK